MYRVRGRLDPEVGALLMRAIEAAGDALFRSNRDWAPEGDTRGPATREITPRQRRADAVGLLVEQAMRMGFGGTGSDGVDDRPAEAENVSAETCGGSDETGATDTKDVSAETSRRLCCDAGVVRANRGPQGEVLDVGRRTRTGSDARSADTGASGRGVVHREVEVVVRVTDSMRSTSSSQRVPVRPVSPRVQVMSPVHGAGSNAWTRRGEGSHPEPGPGGPGWPLHPFSSAHIRASVGIPVEPLECDTRT